mmetsp:Transcript_39513/g.126688  ORF Transcript_39513/g.126688 Transcript_39513/m.126688 type:complete len:84 (-) Transcript_39513:251-502(-)
MEFCAFQWEHAVFEGENGVLLGWGHSEHGELALPTCLGAARGQVVVEGMFVRLPVDGASTFCNTLVPIDLRPAGASHGSSHRH